MAFAAKTIELLRSTSRDSLGAAARARVARDYSWERNLSRVAELIEDAALNESRSRRGVRWPRDGHLALRRRA